MAWAEARKDAGAVAWAAWLVRHLLQDTDPRPLPLGTRLEAHLARAEALVAGPAGADPSELYAKEAGEVTATLVADLRAAAAMAGPMSARDYADFFAGLTADREVRSALRPHADILIWGTQEARVQGADLTILAGLNDGIWPPAPKADPWLNRPLRDQAGLRLPDRVTGLSAHDFQQAVAGRAVWISRAKRDAEADTVPSRWLNRLQNLLSGASDETAAALDQMRARGADWIAQAEALLTPPAPEKPSPRPAPAPMQGPRLTRISVTEVEKLVRDPYALYAKYMLGLTPLDPLRQVADGRLKGQVVHSVLHRFVEATAEGLPEAPEALVRRIADDILAEDIPTPGARLIWSEWLDRAAPFIAATEAELRTRGTPWLLETKKEWPVPGLDLTLVGRADRIDRMPDGRVAIYDYKSGSVPTDKQEKYFTKQLWLEAAMAAGGAFDGGPVAAGYLAYIGLGKGGALRDLSPTPEDVAEILGGLVSLVTHYQPKDGWLPGAPDLRECHLRLGLRPPDALWRMGRNRRCRFHARGGCPWRMTRPWPRTAPRRRRSRPGWGPTRARARRGF